jgi:general secretion pathway protein G
MSPLDGVIFVVLVAIVTAIAVPMLEVLNRRAEESTLRQNLRTLRSQIELYKLEHGGQPPLLHDGEFPQLRTATNAKGVPGPRGEKFPFGPYLKAGVPTNPMTGGYRVLPVDEFPPTETLDGAAWLYHQPTGQIVPNVEGYWDHD